VEIFDTAGRPVAGAVGWVAGEVPPGGRGYFEAPVAKREVSFTVTVYAFAFGPREAS
jgi:hypothetical protein